ncbi:PaaI family thioesterase (plasmid) [Paracoccus marcusii]|uniref:PaaI family thioesterase n=1 Tax=Paracoccus marcusii TaxID=59779 RepID=UPI0038B81EE0
MTGGLSGLDRVRALADGQLPPPPMMDVIPFTLLPPERGIVTLTAIPEARFHNPMGFVHGGWLLTLLDSAMGLAGLTCLEAGTICPTHETAVKFLRPVRVTTGPIRVTGCVLGSGRSVITLDGTAEAADGTLVAHGTSTCIVTSIPRPNGETAT